HEHTGDRGVADAAEAHDQVLDLAEPLAVGVAQRAADHRRQVQDRRGRRLAAPVRGGRVHTSILRPRATARCGSAASPGSMFEGGDARLMPSFWPSIVILSLVQGLVVTLPRALPPARAIWGAR